MKLASGIAPVEAMRKAGIARRPRHRRRRQQQRPRHVRGDAPGGVPAQARRRRSARDSGAGGARDGDHRRGARRSAWRRRSARSSPASAPTCIVVSMASARQTPMYDPVSHLVYVTRGDDVRDDDRQRPRPDAGPPGAHPGSAAGARRGPRCSPTRSAPPSNSPHGHKQRPDLRSRHHARIAALAAEIERDYPAGDEHPPGRRAQGRLHVHGGSGPRR